MSSLSDRLAALNRARSEDDSHLPAEREEVVPKRRADVPTDESLAQALSAAESTTLSWRLTPGR